MVDIALFLAILTGWAVLHSLSMSRAVKGFWSRLLGPRFAFYRLGFTVFSLASFTLALAIAPRLPQPVYAAQDLAAWMLWTLRIMAVGLFAWTFAAFDVLEFAGLRQAMAYPQGRVDSDGEVDASRRLSLTGPYRLVRHPMYLAASVYLFADPDMTLEKLVFAAFATAYFLVGSIMEERRLVEVFGARYADYQRSVPRFVPWISIG